MLLWILAILAVLGQGLDCGTTYYGVYVKKPALAEANTNPLNLWLVGHKWSLLLIKPVAMVAIFITAAAANFNTPGFVAGYYVLCACAARPFSGQRKTSSS